MKKASVWGFALALMLMLVVTSAAFGAMGKSTIGQDGVRGFDPSYLVKAGVTESEIAALGDDALVVQSIIESERLDYAAVRNLVSSLLNSPKPQGETYPVVDGAVVYPDGTRTPLPRKPDQNTSGEVIGIAATCPEHAGTGPYWEVDSVTSYTEATGYAHTPSNQYLSRDKDVQYMFLGAKSNSGAIDAGIFLKYGASDYRWFIYGGTSPNGWREESIPVQVRPGKTLYLWLKVLNNQVRLRIIDPATWTTVVDVTEGVDPAKKISASESSIRVFKVTSLAQVKNYENFQSGSYFFDAHWYTVYVYKSTGYGLLNTSRTGCTDEYPDSPDVVNTTVVDQYYEDYVDIDLR